MRQLLLKLAERGKTLLVTSHILPELARICDRVAIITRGKLRGVRHAGRDRPAAQPSRTIEALLLKAEDVDRAAADHSQARRTRRGSHTLRRRIGRTVSHRAAPKTNWPGLLANLASANVGRHAIPRSANRPRGSVHDRRPTGRTKVEPDRPTRVARTAPHAQGRRRSGRRWRPRAALLVLVRWPTGGVSDLSGARSLQVLRVFGYGLLVAVLFLVPAFPATALVREKVRGTLALLLNSPMSPTSIYLGKLGGVLGFTAHSVADDRAGGGGVLRPWAASPAQGGVGMLYVVLAAVDAATFHARTARQRPGAVDDSACASPTRSSWRSARYHWPRTGCYRAIRVAGGRSRPGCGVCRRSRR